MGRHPQPGRRAALLDACTRHLLDRGMSELSITALAAAAGTSARMLIYHFGTKDQLVTEALHEARRRQQALSGGLLQPRPGVPYPAVLRAAWRQLTSPEAMPYHRLFRELHDLPAESSPWTGFPAHATDEWLATVTAGLQAAGYEDPRVAATLIVAAARGLLLDLQVTSDRERADAAFDTLIDLLPQGRTGPGDRTAVPP
jgi:AcrR family transcriptional regulator